LATDPEPFRDASLANAFALPAAKRWIDKDIASQPAFREPTRRVGVFGTLRSPRLAQSERFIRVAKGLGVDESSGAFERVIEALLPTKLYPVKEPNSSMRSS